MSNDFYVVCHNIRSLHNIGSIFRTADAFGISKIYLGGYSGTPMNLKLSKTALGAENFVPWEFKYDTWRIIDNLKAKGIRIVALETSGKTDIRKYKPRFPMALVLGNEVKGLSKSIINKCDESIYIPMMGKKESLNVSVAFSIVGFELNKFKVGM